MHASASGSWRLGDLTVNRLGYGPTPAQVRLAWTLAKGPHVLAIPGTGSTEHLVENVATGALRLSAGDVARLDTVHEAS